MARERKTLRENPGPPGRGLRKGLTTLSHKKHCKNIIKNITETRALRVTLGMKRICDDDY